MAATEAEVRARCIMLCLQYIRGRGLGYKYYRGGGTKESSILDELQVSLPRARCQSVPRRPKGEVEKKGGILRPR